MNTKKSQQAIGIAGTLLLISYMQSLAQSLQLDDFNSADVIVRDSVHSSFGDPVEGVFGGRRFILLDKKVADSATFISVGSGVLTWNQTGEDSSSVGFGSGDLSGYDAFRVTVVSAPPNAGDLEIRLGYSVTNKNYSITLPTSLPASGTGIVEVPFSLIRTRIAEANWPTTDMTAVSVALDFRGGPPGLGRTTNGRYVFDKFEAIAYAPPPSLFVGAALNWRGFQLLQLAWTNNGSHCVLESSGTMPSSWIGMSPVLATNANRISTVVVSSGPARFYRLRTK